MFRLGRRAAIAVSIAALSAPTAGGVLAASRSSDEDALAPARPPADRGIESRVNDLLSRMTLEEKLEQIQLLPDFLVTDDEVKKGLGSAFSITDPAKIDHFQHLAVEQSRLHIPMLFAFDTIHGFRTIFPIPLGPPAASIRRSRPTTTRSARASRPRSGSSRSTRRWSTSRTSPDGAASPRRAARTRT
jgi:beta-glucosidase